MSNFDEQIEKEKQRYLDFVELNKKRHIYIYGAGKQAVPIADFFKENNITIEGFCVTDKSSNKKSINHTLVYQVDEIPYKDKDTAFVFGVRVQLNNEIKKNINRTWLYKFPACNRFNQVHRMLRI